MWWRGVIGESNSKLLEVCFTTQTMAERKTEREMLCLIIETAVAKAGSASRRLQAGIALWPLYGGLEFE